MEREGEGKEKGGSEGEERGGEFCSNNYYVVLMVAMATS